MQPSIDGRSHLDGGGATGYWLRDSLLKGIFSSNGSGDHCRKLQFNAARGEEIDNEIDLGLRLGDFRPTLNRRCAAQQPGRIDIEQPQLSRCRRIKPSDGRARAGNRTSARLYQRLNTRRRRSEPAPIGSARIGADFLLPLTDVEKQAAHGLLGDVLVQIRCLKAQRLKPAGALQHPIAATGDAAALGILRNNRQKPLARRVGCHSAEILGARGIAAANDAERVLHAHPTQLFRQQDLHRLVLQEPVLAPELFDGSLGAASQRLFDA